MHEVITGDYETAVGRWESHPLPIGQRLQEPGAVFHKLDDSIVEDELRRMASRATPTSL